jgi:hypothetical protein
LALVPTDGVAAARVAQGLGLAGAAADQVASALSASYRLEPEHPTLKAWRPAVAFSVWAALEPTTQAAALTEACLYGREGEEPYGALVAAATTATDRGLRTQLSALVKDGACRGSPVGGTPASRS